MFGFLLAGMYREAKRAILSSDPIDRALAEGLLVATCVLAIINFIWPFLSNGGAPQIVRTATGRPPTVVKQRELIYFVNDGKLVGNGAAVDRIPPKKR